MNSPALLISSTATAAGAAPVAADEAPAEDGFSSALASSIAGAASRTGGAADEAVTPAAEMEEAPSLADVAQWLGLPVATTAAAVPVGADSSADSGDALPADGDALMPQQEVLAAASARLASPPGAATKLDSTAAIQDGDPAETDALLPLLAAGDQTPAASPAPTSSSSTVTPSLATLAPPPSVTLSAALLRDGVASTPAAAPSVRASLHETVGSARWADELGSRLVMMSVRGQQEGSLTLMPEHLGPLEVQISINKDTANVWFGAQHADTRAALTEALPRLRELLAGSGLSLGQAGVSEQTPRRPTPDAESSRSGAGGLLDSSVSEVTPPAWRSMRAGLIDTYA